MTYCKPFVRGVSWRSQDYGAFPNNGTNGPAGHSGADEAAAIGTPVHAAGDGVVEYAGTFDDTYADNLLWLIDFGGNVLVLDCGAAEPTFVYGHLSKFLVAPGERVRKGQIIALSGNSGTRTTGPHCHVEAIPPGYVLNSPTLGRVNPDTYLTEYPEDIISLSYTVAGTIDTAATGATVEPETTLGDKMLVLATNGSDAQVWVGDGVLRRPIWTLDTMSASQWLASNKVLGPFYKDGQVQAIPDLNSIGIDVTALAGKDVNGR